MERAVMEKVMWWYSASLIVAASLSPPSSDMSAMFHNVRNGDKCFLQCGNLKSVTNKLL